ncbi:MAG: hypothetical protein KDD56_03775 [Bdellovibrionales bacterium]|nr:hypothetical protein [Bdellovibrionales bacterium]
MNLIELFNAAFTSTVDKAKKLSFDSGQKVQAEVELLRESLEINFSEVTVLNDSLEQKEIVLNLIVATAISKGLLEVLIENITGEVLPQTTQHLFVDAWTEIKTSEAIIQKMAAELSLGTNKMLAFQQYDAGCQCLLKGLELFAHTSEEYGLASNWADSAIGIQRYLRKNNQNSLSENAISEAVNKYAGI